MVHQIRTIDAHTAGEPLRLVVDGLPAPEGGTMLQRRAWAMKHLDHLRRAIMLEPRGHADMYGALLTEPVTPGAHAGVLFMHNEGWSTMCGHGVIAVATIAVERGLMWDASTADGPAVFRLPEHLKRLENSCKVYRMEIPYDRAQLTEAVFDTIGANDMRACYIRPLIFRGFGLPGINPLPLPVEVVIAVWAWGKYLGDAADQGVDVCVSSWRRSAPQSSPAVAKATANYLNSQLSKGLITMSRTKGAK